MQDVLTHLNRIRGVGGSLLLSQDGLPMASALRSDTDESQLAAAVAEALGAAQRLVKQLNLGIPSTLTANHAQGTLLILGAGPAFVALLVEPTANQALLQIEAKAVVERIAQRISL